MVSNFPKLKQFYMLFCLLYFGRQLETLWCLLVLFIQFFFVLGIWGRIVFFWLCFVFPEDEMEEVRNWKHWKSLAE